MLSRTPAAGAPPSAAAPPVGSGVAWLLPFAVLAAAASPTLWSLATRVWPAQEQSHGPVILAVALWLMWQRRDRIAALPAPAGWGPAALVMSLAFVLLVFGRSQGLLQAEVLGLWLAGAAWLMLAAGVAALRAVALPLLALLLVVPMPGIVVQEVTLPLKIAVSTVAEQLLHSAGYPVARSGVILAVDQYKLLVADACAGLASMFTLEAMGLLYMQLRGPSVQRWRDVTLAVLLVPIALAANVVRTMVLVLVTFHLGEAAVQGLLHGLAGVVLFGVAMVLMLVTDAGLAAVERRRIATRGGPA